MFFSGLNNTRLAVVVVFKRSNLELWYDGWSLVPADVTSCRAPHMVTTPGAKRNQQQMSTSVSQIRNRASTTAWRADMRGAEVPLRSCCASAALGRAPPVCCEPARRGCARPAAGPSPSSLAAASSAEPSAASDHSDAPPTARNTLKNHNLTKTHKTRVCFLLHPLTSSACFLMMASSFCSGVLSLFKLCISSMASFPERPQRVAHTS